MIFGTIILVLVAGVAFYHYLQGFFSAMISVVLAILAGMIAVSYHEPIADLAFASTIPNYAHATALVGLFGLVYVFSRLLTDRLVPGNVRLPVLVDKIGGGAAGAIAGAYAAGVLAVAAQLLPIGPDIAGYSRYEIGDREVSGVRLPGKYQAQDLMVYGELKSDSMDGSSSSLKPIPADDILLGTASYLSNGGSLAGDRRLSDVHPKYQDELFGHRLGPAKGGDAAFTTQTHPGVTVQAVYQGKRFLNNPEDFELKVVRGGQSPTVNMLEDSVPLVVRVTLLPAGPSTGNAFNMGSIRLVIGGKNYIPIGSVQRGDVFLMTRPDDILFTDGAKPIDLMFIVDGSALPLQEGGSKRVIPAGAFIEARRGARVTLGGRDIAENIPGGSSNVGIVEKDKKSQQ